MENNTNIEISNQNEVLEWARYSFICFMSLVTIFGVPGNSIVLLVLMKLKVKRSTDFLIMTMCVTDLITSTINSSLFIFRYQPSIWEKIASTSVCRLHKCLILATLISSTLLFAATAYDRLRKTKSTSTRDTIPTIRKSKCLCIGTVTFGIIYGIIYMFTVTLDPDTLKCVHITEYRTMATMFRGILALLFIFMFVVVFVCYTKISLFLRRHHLRFQSQQTIINMHTMSKHKFLNRNTRFQPLSQEMNMRSPSQGTSLNITPITRNERDNLKSNAGLVQNSTNTHNKDQGNNILTVSTKTHARDHDFKQPEAVDSNQDNVAIQEDAVPPEGNRLRLHAHSERHRKKINKTILMMFLTTSIYIITWIIIWSSQIYKVATNNRSLKADFLMENLYMILCVTNPLFYMSISSKLFRTKAKEMFCK